MARFTSTVLLLVCGVLLTANPVCGQNQQVQQGQSPQQVAAANGAGGQQLTASQGATMQQAAQPQQNLSKQKSSLPQTGGMSNGGTSNGGMSNGGGASQPAAGRETAGTQQMSASLNPEQPQRLPNNGMQQAPSQMNGGQQVSQQGMSQQAPQQQQGVSQQGTQQQQLGMSQQAPQQQQGVPQQGMQQQGMPQQGQQQLGMQQQGQQPGMLQMASQESSGGLRGSAQSSLGQQTTSMAALQPQGSNLRSPSDSTSQSLQGGSSMQQQESQATSGESAIGGESMMLNVPAMNSPNGVMGGAAAGGMKQSNGGLEQTSTVTQSNGATQSMDGAMSGGADNEAAGQQQQLSAVENNNVATNEGATEEKSSANSEYPAAVDGYATKGRSAVPKSDNGAMSALKDETSTSQLKHGKFNTEEDSAECRPLQPQKRQVTATWLSSFPGSGSRMVWKLIEAITGLYTGDDLDSAGHVSSGVAVAIKTHFPSHTKSAVFNQQMFAPISRGILLLRNPMNSIPALFRFVYYIEQKNERTGAPPPAKAWISWRNQYFERELELWLQHTKWWLHNYKRENLHLLPFEYLSSPLRGSDELQRVGNFLGSTDPTIAASLLEPEKFCCVWEKLVNQDDLDKAKKVAPYTAEHLEAIIQGLIQLRDNNKSFPEFFALMDEYLGEIVDVKKELLAMTRKESPAVAVM